MNLLKGVVYIFVVFPIPIQVRLGEGGSIELKGKDINQRENILNDYPYGPHKNTDV